MVRTQLYLDDGIHLRLRDLAGKQGRTVSELVRDALVRVYGEGTPDRRIKTLQTITGLWLDREDIGATHEYVRALRRDTRRGRTRRR